MPRPIPEDAPSIKECRRLAKERRERITADLVAYFTSDKIDSAELAHFRTIAHFFGIDRTVKQIAIDYCDTGEEMVLEVMLAVALCSLERAIR